IPSSAHRGRQAASSPQVKSLGVCIRKFRNWVEALLYARGGAGPSWVGQVANLQADCESAFPPSPAPHNCRVWRVESDEERRAHSQTLPKFHRRRPPHLTRSGICRATKTRRLALHPHGGFRSARLGRGHLLPKPSKSLPPVHRHNRTPLRRQPQTNQRILHPTRIPSRPRSQPPPPPIPGARRLSSAREPPRAGLEVGRPRRLPPVPAR